MSEGRPSAHKYTSSLTPRIMIFPSAPQIDPVQRHAACVRKMDWCVVVQVRESAPVDDSVDY